MLRATGAMWKQPRVAMQSARLRVPEDFFNS